MAALASARTIKHLSVVPYPKSIKAPNPDLNIAAVPGKFSYDRDFLLQFMGLCKRKPDALPPLDTIGLAPYEQGAKYSAGPRTGERRRVGSMGMGGAPYSRAKRPWVLVSHPAYPKAVDSQWVNFNLQRGARNLNPGSTSPTIAADFRLAARILVGADFTTRIVRVPGTSPNSAK